MTARCLRRRLIHPVLAVALVASAGCASSSTSVSPAAPTATVAVPTGTAPEPTPTPVPTAEPGATTDAAGSTLTDLLADAVRTERGGGVSMIVRLDGESFTGAVGTADADGSELTVESRFRVGSISKPFIAVMVLQLVEEGQIDLDAPLSTYLAATPVGGDVDIRLLLNHRSGLPNYTSPSMFADVARDTSRVYRPDQILQWVIDEPPQPADESFAYSNTNYILLGQLIESLDGGDLNESLRRRITAPLGIESTFFDVGDDPVETIVGGWSNGLSAGAADDEITSIVSSAWAAGALVSSGPELLTFLDGLFDGRLLSDESLTAMTDTGVDDYGLGLFRLPLNGAAYGHNGSIPGYHSLMALNPETGDAVVALSNADRIVAGQVATEILPELIARG